MEFLLGHKDLDKIIIGYLNKTILFSEELLGATSDINVPSSSKQKRSTYIMIRGLKMWRFFRTNKSSFLPYYKDYARANNVSDKSARDICKNFYYF